MTINVENPSEVRQLTRRISQDVGESAGIALREFLANVYEHCQCKDVDIVELPTVLIVYDHGGGIRCRRTRKAKGEGGYGLRIIRQAGAKVRNWKDGAMLVVTR